MAPIEPEKREGRNGNRGRDWRLLIVFGEPNVAVAPRHKLLCCALRINVVSHTSRLLHVRIVHTRTRTVSPDDDSVARIDVVERRRFLISATRSSSSF